MSKHQRNAAGALGAAAGLALAEGEAAAPGELPDASAGPENAAAEFVASEVVAERDALRAENGRLAGELADERAARASDLQELRGAREAHAATLAERDELATRLAVRDAVQREIAALGPGDAPATARTRPVFDASYVHAVDGRRATFSPGDPVPDHIDPAALPAGVVRYASEET